MLSPGNARIMQIHNDHQTHNSDLSTQCTYSMLLLCGLYSRRREVAPVFEMAGIDVEVVVTQYQFHARDATFEARLER